MLHAHHHRHRGWPSHPAAVTLAVTSVVFLLPYVLLEKKLLPRAWWRTLGRLYFYPLMLPNLLLRLASGQPYFSDVDGGVMLGAVPMVVAGHARALHKDGVRAVLNMQAEYEGPLAAYAEQQPPIVQHRIPVVDHVEPTLEQLEEGVQFVAAHRALGERVLIHCKGGHGRSAAVAMAWLLSPQGGALSPEAAQQRLSSVRHVRSSLLRQPAILAFYARHGSSSAAAMGGDRLHLRQKR